MIVFSSPEAAMREGFRVIDFDAEYQLYIVEKVLRRGRRKARVCAFARYAAAA